MRVLRQATPSDAEGIHRCHLRSWAAAYADIPGLAGVLDTADALERRRAQLADADIAAWVCVEGEQVLGFVTAGPERRAGTDRRRGGDGPDSPEIYALYVEPTVWGQGIGSALLGAVTQELARRWRVAGEGPETAETAETAEAAQPVKVAEITLWVLTTNHRAHAFYARHGFAPTGQRRAVIAGLDSEEERWIRAMPPPQEV